MCYRVGRGDKQLFKLFMAASKKVDKIAEIKQELHFFFIHVPRGENGDANTLAKQDWIVSFWSRFLRGYLYCFLYCFLFNRIIYHSEGK